MVFNYSSCGCHFTRTLFSCLVSLTTRSVFTYMFMLACIFITPLFCFDYFTSLRSQRTSDLYKVTLKFPWTTTRGQQEARTMRNDWKRIQTIINLNEAKYNLSCKFETADNNFHCRFIFSHWLVFKSERYLIMFQTKPPEWNLLFFYW